MKRRRMEATAVDLHCNDGQFKPQECEGRRVRTARLSFGSLGVMTCSAALYRQHAIT